MKNTTLETSRIPYLKLKNGSVWEFQWDDRFQGWTYMARKHLYKIFIDGVKDRKYDWETPMVWIGMFVPRYEDGGDEYSWVTVEKEIGDRKSVV